MTNPRISVIMPVYNVEAYIAEAIDSVLAQTFADFELIIVDDGGTDRSMSICFGYDDPRIKIVSQINRGLAGARNTGIQHSKGDYIALLDSDDRWLPDKLMLHVIHLDSAPNVGVSYSGSYLIDAQGNRLRQSQRPKCKAVDAQEILCRNPVGNGSAAVIRRSVLNDVSFIHPTDYRRVCYFDESFKQSEDIELWVRIALNSKYIFDGLQQCLTEYRIVSGGLSANIARQYDTWQRMINKAKIYDAAFIAQYGERAKAYQLRYLARRSIQMGDGSFAMTLILESLRASVRPLFEEPYKTLTTLGAALIARFCQPERLVKLAGIWTKAKVVV